jgi:dihydroorotate dehydrogenase electron transfer subunit
MPLDQEIEVISHRQVARDTFLMGLRSPEIAKQATPGQFVMVRVRPDLDPLLRRPFSFCSTQGKDFFLLYRVMGRGTAILSQIREGERLSVLGILGKGFELPGDGEKSLLIGGGIGVAPLVFLAQHLDVGAASFLTGYRSKDEVIGGGYEGLESLQDADLATDDGTLGFKGLVTELFEGRLAEQGGKRVRVFSCGPVPMLKQVVSLVDRHGLSCQVSLEANMACGLGACQGCAVKAARDQGRTYFHVCQDGPVFWSEQIDWKNL